MDITSNTTKTPLDVWMHFENETDEEPDQEANTFEDGDGGYFVERYHTAVGYGNQRRFKTYDEAVAWLTELGFQDFSS